MDGFKSKVHAQFCSQRQNLEDWFRKRQTGLRFSFYSSYDIREADFKVAPVDANLFPAGYNNICQVDKENVPELVQNFFNHTFDPGFVNGTKTVGLFTEEHTKNKYYWDNIFTLQDFLNSAHIKSEVLFPGDMAGAPGLGMDTASGKKVQAISAKENFSKFDLILSNNDFSKQYDFLEPIKEKIHPPYDQGWHRRKKSTFFSNYNALATEFAKVLESDPWKYTVHTEEFAGFEVESESSRNLLAEKVDAALHTISAEYKKRSIDYPPFVVVKNNAGTYGLGVVTVRSGEEVKNWTYKARKKMKATKGGGGIDDVIIQEGIPSVIKTDQNETAEPVVYMIGSELAGGFLRVNAEKGPDENLNAPGSVYKRMCLSDLRIDYSKVPMENVYGWICKVAAMAVAQELS